MSHVDALTAAGTDATPLLIEAHCALDDGGVNEAGRALYKARQLRASMTSDELAWFVDLESLYLAGIGSFGGGQ